MTFARPLPPRQQIAFDFIKSEVSFGRRRFPSAQEIANFMGWSQASSAQDLLRRLEYRGLIKRNAEYKWELTEAAQ